LTTQQFNGKIVMIFDGNPVRKHKLAVLRVAVFGLVKGLYADFNTF
jgi:hypothetical protein